MNRQTSLSASHERDVVSRDSHIAPWLWHAFAADQAAFQLNGEALGKAVEHLQICEACQAEIGFLASLADAAHMAPAPLSALLAHVSPDLVHDASVAMVPSDEALGVYLALKDSIDSETARQHFPAVAAHLEVCRLCQAEVENILRALDDEAPNVTAAAPQVLPMPPVPPDSEHESDWLRPNAWTRRLRAPYEIWVRPQALRITSTLAYPQIESSDTRDPSGSGDCFTIMLHEGSSASTETSVRLYVELQALYTQRVCGHLRAVRLSGPATPAPAAGLPWRINAGDQSESVSPGRRGKTDEDGTADFSMRGAGNYRFTIVVDACEWTVPLIIRSEASLDDDRSNPSNPAG